MRYFVYLTYSEFFECFRLKNWKKFFEILRKHELDIKDEDSVHIWDVYKSGDMFCVEFTVWKNAH
ncbi:protein of unknown function [Methanocaldococcus lauensis]|uniref:Uncharacterized protein n=1 Tax=Methanocaldococcus lauensis TaxID=2546128 RepID=A0A8D6PVN9_9EURY|nr:hypothetical protein [Methanocaldococcus lauensis]CAB3288186.1 protein of unknown function [Methanocaldococcus lauensis]